MNVTNLEREAFKGRINGKTLRRLVSLVAPHWPLVLGFVLCVAFTACMDSINTYVNKLIIDRGAIGHDAGELVRWCMVLLVCFVANSASIFVFFICAGRLAESLQYDLRTRMFSHLLSLSFSFFDRMSSGWLLSRITSDAQRIAQLTSWMFLDTIWGTMNIVIAMCFMFAINWHLALISGVTIPLIVVTALVFRMKIVREYRKVRSINSEITHAYTENIGGIRVVKSCTAEERNHAAFMGITARMHDASFRAGWLSAIFLPVVQLVTSIGVAAILLVGGSSHVTGDITLGDLRAFIGYITFMLWPVQDLARVWSEMQQAIASAERVFALMDTQPDIVDMPNALTEARFEGKVELLDVDFHYKSGMPVLSGFSLSAKPGERVALVGPTGGGKSTIVSLVARFYEPVSGRILFDGRDYRDYTQEALRMRIGVVLQHPHLFSGTVCDNIRYARPDATREEIENACRLVHAHETIARLPRGYEEEVGEGGGLLSVGQRQLLSLARVFLADPDVIVMDEATSSIDTMTEEAIQRGLATILAGKTSFIIAHRLSTIRDADNICFIDRGRIVETGTHAELMAMRGRYHGLYTNLMESDGKLTAT